MGQRSAATLTCLITYVLAIRFVQGQYVNSCGCIDRQPPAIDCYHQKYTLNSCDTEWVVQEDYCAFTCGRCICLEGCMCTDHPPDASYTCEQLKFFEKCDEKWMLDGNHCEFTCGRCNCTTISDSQSQQQQYAAGAASPAVVPTVILSGNDVPSVNEEQADVESFQQTLLSNSSVCGQEFLNLLESNPATAYLSDLFANTSLMMLFQTESPLPYTFFLPNKQAWDLFLFTLSNSSDLTSNSTLIQQLLQTHIVQGQQTYGQLLQVSELQTLLQDVSMQVLAQGETIAIGVNGHTNYYAQVNALSFCNSVVYIINGVLVPNQSPINDLLAVSDHFLNVVVADGYQEAVENVSDVNNSTLEEDDDTGQCSNKTALEIINQHPQLKIFSQLLTKIEAFNVLERTDLNMTLFLPIDDAEITAGSAGKKNQASLLQLDPQVIRDIVRYHVVVSELVELEEIESQKQYITLSDNRFLTLVPGEPFDKVKGVSYSANIVDADIVNACTVRVHLLDRVLMPYSPEQAEALYPSSPSPSPTTVQDICEQTAWDIVSSQEGLGILEGLSEQVRGTLSQKDQQMTVFLPDAYGQSEITQLAQELGGVLESPQDIAYDFITQHVVPYRQVKISDGMQPTVYESLASLPVEVVQEGQDFYAQTARSSAQVTLVDQLNTCNPVVVHNIQGALFPFPKENSGTKGIPSEQEMQQAASATQTQCNTTQTLVDYILEEPSLSYIVEKAGDQLETFFQPANKMATYFLPVNDAFIELAENQAVMDTFKTEDILVRELLKYHAIPDKYLTARHLVSLPTRKPYHHITRFNSISLTFNKQFGTIMVYGYIGVGKTLELSAYESCKVVVHLIDTALLPIPINDTSIPSRTTTAAPVSSPSASFVGGQQVEVAAVRDAASRGDSSFNFQVANASAQTPSPVVAPTLGSDISQFFQPAEQESKVPAPQTYPANGAPSQSGDACDQTIGSVLDQINRLKLMSQYMRLAGYANYLDQTDANITIIAPIDVAFDVPLVGHPNNLTLRELSSDETQRELFVRIISYHIIPYPVNVKDTPVGTSGSFGTLEFDEGGYNMQLKMKKYMQPFAQGETIEVEGALNNATVSGSPLGFCKAFIYPVDKVLSLSNEPSVAQQAVVVQNPGPFRPQVDQSSLLPDVVVTTCIKPLQIIQNQNDLSTFINLLYYAEINEVINNLENITIFAPMDLNLNQILSQFMDSQDVTPLVIQNWMAYHIVTGVYLEADLVNGVTLETLTVDNEGNKMKLEVVRGEGAENGQQTYLQGVFNEAYIVRGNLQACDAVVHIVNMPLLPVRPNGRRRA